ncbi:tRNA lysidine(34) synthetase TilS [Pseudoalteromonas sp. NEC-BIFX-2020_015]|uniref:tRNA lysidine(34) synthetase TilS n=1 Tax=Pseudoalteromonas sp. NEC-BIFX-2020_015 TaxID=2729544 RepID=UPI0014615177|nr:tRNA lysidine(34) synthetase TilS [Pseudoalteromonas sp. NEC-BIFX-2020_015]NMR26490.1 tRNA lysidine(34) synthetase TilS [Pseudoalteromonas sp. NEC-BIFX-2020_015]
MHSTSLYQHVKNVITPYVVEHKISFTVALSGGVDSVVLLHVMNALKAEVPQLQLNAVYVNHGLSEYANNWQSFCKKLCATLNITFYPAQVNIENKARTSLEELARDARYQALDHHSPTGSIILLGQHLNDQIETFLLRLKRGSGLQGLASMRQTRTLNSGRMCLRPLLNVTRQNIEQFADDFNLSHITDDSNSDERFDRNFLRGKVVPVLSEKFTGFEKSASRSISLLQQQQDVLDEYTQLDLAQSQNEHRGLSCEKMGVFSLPRQANVLRCWLGQFTRLMPSQKQTQQILLQGLTAQRDAQLLIQLAEGQVRRHQGYLYFVNESVTAQKEQSVTSDNQKLSDGCYLMSFCGEGVRSPFADEQVTVRFNCPQARIKPLKKPGHNTLKHWFKDAKVAPWLRANIPLIFYNEQLVFVVGHFVSAEHYEQEGIFWKIKI